MMAGDDNGTSTCLLSLLDEVSAFDAFLLVGGAELVGQVVVPDTPCVDDGFLRKDVLARFPESQLLI